MFEKYYIIYFDEDIKNISFFENKLLKKDQYTPSDVESNYVFSDIVYLKKELKSEVDFLNEKFYYDGYKLKEFDCSFSNDCEKDGFMYDKSNQRVIYGQVGVYATLQGDSYVDIVTGKVIPRSIIKDSVEICNFNFLKTMISDLSLSFKYFDAYSEILDDYITMFSSDLVNKEVVSSIYYDLCIEEDVIEIREHQKIKNIIDNLKGTCR